MVSSSSSSVFQKMVGEFMIALAKIVTIKNVEFIIQAQGSWKYLCNLLMKEKYN